MTLDTSIRLLLSDSFPTPGEFKAKCGGCGVENKDLHYDHFVCLRSLLDRNAKRRRATTEPTAENCWNRIQEHSGTQEYACLPVAEHYVVHLCLTRR